MIAIAHDQERLRREFLCQPLQETPVVMRCHPLTTNVFINVRGIAEITPIQCKLGTQARVPGKMIGHGVNVEEERPIAALAFDNFGGLIEIKTISLEVTRAEVEHVQIARDAGRRLEGTRTEKSAIERIEAEGLIAAAAR